MNMMQLFTAGGPYYVIGFIITFFTLMSSRYTLGYDIHPQRKFMRIMFVSVFWFISLVVSAMIVYFKRGEDLGQHDNEKEAMRVELEALRSEAAAKAAESKPLQPSHVYSDEEITDIEQVLADDDAVPALKPKRKIGW